MKIFLISQAKMPQRNDNAVTIFNIITHNNSLNECDYF
jgi:hypothetical protein